MKTIRQVLAAMPELDRFSERMESTDWPTAAEVAHSRWKLAQARVEAQQPLPLKGAE